MKGLLWVYDGKIVKDTAVAAVNLRIVPAKQQIMKIILIGIQADNYAVARTVDAYIHLNPDDNGISEYLFKKDMDSSSYIYPTPDDINHFGSIDTDRIYLTDGDDLVITIQNLDNAGWFRISVRAIISTYALPNLTYQYTTADKDTTNTIYQNKIIGVIE